eukprot:GFUD01011948.1.p1 GENE.GFUD01011948.1~~GFUD01011948.1.p1  ORF type:complete len:265 (-),score=59.94 GFUD01011948.1:1123-1917(-)
MDNIVLTGVAAAAGASVVGLGVTAVANDTLNQVTGQNRQCGDKMKVLFNSIGKLLGIGGTGDLICTTEMLALFSKQDDYKERSRRFIGNIHEKNPECGIKKEEWNTTIQMDVFQAFGAPGHLGVHAGLMIAYPGLGDWFITLSVDLAAIPAEKILNGDIPENTAGSDISSSGISKCAVSHTLTVVDGIDESIWEYMGSVNMGLLDLINIVARAMKQGAARGDYNLRSNNSIHFKNDILAIVEGNFHNDRKIPSKTNINKFDLCT